MASDKKLLKSLPKVLLHEHLDGVLRPQTVIDLAKDENMPTFPPATRPRSLNGSTRARTREAWRNIWKVSRTPSR